MADSTDPVSVGAAASGRNTRQGPLAVILAVHLETIQSAESAILFSRVLVAFRS